MDFIQACKEGILVLAQELYNNAQINEAFISSCENGQIEIAKWLHNVGVDTHSLNDSAFRFSCQNGHLDLAKWLHSLGVDIHAKNNDAFVYSCIFRHFVIAKWLHSLDSTIIWLTIKRISDNILDHLEIDSQNKTLLRCIKNDQSFPQLDQIDDIVVKSLVHYNMIDHLKILQTQFNYIQFDVVDDKVTNLSLKRFTQKSARKFI